MNSDWPLEAEALLATAYSLFLVAVAFVLECLARHAHYRSRSFQTNGFIYHSPRDEWECPGGHSLERQYSEESDLMRYRAKAEICNACIRKNECTDSHKGREIVYRQSAWVQTQVGRFQRGISLLLLTIAAFILFIEILRYQGKPECFLLFAVLLVIVVAGSWSARGFIVR